LSVTGAGGQWFFAHDVFAGVESGYRQREVARVGRADMDHRHRRSSIASSPVE